MPIVQRKSDVVENFAASALSYGIGAVVCLAGALVFWIFRGSGMFIGLVWVLSAGFLGLAYMAIKQARRIRKVTSYVLECVFCNREIELLEKPKNDDVTCPECHRLIPIQNGEALPVSQVRCGFCNTLNYYSAKSEYLICENCDREIPIQMEEGHQPKHAPRGYVIDDDNTPYNLTLVELHNPGQANEDAISCLQHMLALNRNQVKDLLSDLPTTLLVGIPRKKAELLAAQLSVNGMTGKIEKSA